jgi:cytochrome c
MRILVSAAALGLAVMLAGPVTAQTIPLDIKGAAGAAVSGDTARGQTVFKKCVQCHSPVKGKNGTGPSLHGIVGRPAGSVANFRYSEANKKSGIKWTEQELFVYLENPKKRIPKTIMAFAGLPKAQDRADLIAFLKVNGQK